MVKLCYLVSLIVATASATNGISTQYAQQHQFKMMQQPATKKQVVLSKNSVQVLNDNLLFHPHLQKRGVSYSSSKSKQIKKINGKTYSSQKKAIKENSRSQEQDLNEDDDDFKSSSAMENDEDDDNNDDADSSSIEVNSYAFKKLQKKLGLKGKKFDMPVKGPVPDWDDQFYENDGRPIVYQVDTEELKDIMDHYLEMGKEKWAGFLATSDCGKFQKLLQKLKKLKGDDDCEEEPVKKPQDDCDDDKDNSDKKYGNFKTNPSKPSTSNDLPLPSTSTKGKQPSFANLPEAELENFQSMLSDVISYWENEDARKILQNGSGLTYKDFELEVDESEKKKPLTKGKKVSSQNFDDFENYQTEDELEYNEEGDEIEELLSEYDNMDIDLFETMDPKYAQTVQQREWLKANALRRAKMLQALLNGNLDSEAMKKDIMKFRDGDIYLEEDDNEVIANAGFKLQSTNLAMYIFFMVEAMFFYMF